MSGSSKKKELESSITPALQDLRVELVLLEYKKEGRDWFVRVFIDHPEGVTLDLCEKVHRHLNDRLDELDPIPHAYTLEVSSPGVERPLIQLSHFERFRGERVQVRLKRPLDGLKSLTGILASVMGEEIEIEREPDSQTVRLPLSLISKANLKPIVDIA